MQNHARRSDGGSDLGLRPGQHYDPQDYRDDNAEPQEYDPRAYAPNPDEPYDYDADGQPLYYEQDRAVRSGRGGLLMIGAVLAVALIGGAGAVAYRMAGPGGVGGEPPLIKAETQPVKTTPEAVAGGETTSQNKQIYDRVGVDPGQKSKVVSREEEPVDLPASQAPAVSADSARVILPGGPASVEPTPPATMGAEPRRVKTVEIKPDSSYDDPAPARPAANDPIAQTAATGQAPRGSEFDNGIMSDGPGAPPAPRAQAAPPPAQARPAPPPPVRTPTAAAPAPAPVRAPQPALAATPRDQQVATAAVPRAAAPAAPAAPRTAAPGGGFVVQVTSQRSDADARAAYANLQKRFPQVLGSYSANIQTATVGDRGTYYRVRVGPFADGAQASTVCNNLRAAGGDCVVSRN